MPIKSAFLKVIVTFVLIFLFFLNIKSQESRDSVPVRVMFYNVENLFDTEDDPHKDDNDFLPSGLMRWNHTRYERKLSSLYKTIVAAGDWEPPAIIGMCEVENRKVLEDLIYGTYLSNFNFGIIHEESPDSRGIDVCMIYKKELVDIYYTKSWIPRSISRKDFHSRSVLYVKCGIGGDTLHLIINHWPSRRGGVLAGEPFRSEISDMVRSAADSISISSKNAKIIIMGDFNCAPDDPAVLSLVGQDSSNSDGAIILSNLSGQLKPKNSGTFRYNGKWEVIDQVIVSGSLLKADKGLYTSGEALRIFNPDFLQRTDPKYPGPTTYPTYLGYRYMGGFSDHLPVLLDLSLK